MRFQFSILTMLVCTAVLAVVCAAAARIDVSDRIPMSPPSFGFSSHHEGILEISRPATASDIALRLAWAGPMALLVSLCLLWASRRIAKRFFMRGRVDEME